LYPFDECATAPLFEVLPTVLEVFRDTALTPFMLFVAMIVDEDIISSDDERRRHFLGPPIALPMIGFATVRAIGSNDFPRSDYKLLQVLQDLI